MKSRRSPLFPGAMASSPPTPRTGVAALSPEPVTVHQREAAACHSPVAVSPPVHAGDRRVRDPPAPTPTKPSAGSSIRRRALAMHGRHPHRSRQPGHREPCLLPTVSDVPSTGYDSVKEKTTWKTALLCCPPAPSIMADADRMMMADGMSTETL
ncbi:hypothetical protein THAOC_29433 [Thalassiosira oceanica]|uniref:Uncharacterized protein n=1 Tax=Thalassiosira oceanica TaxID=159749 RepID=K0RR68_THAOC|nr:hypothetical protein THAOC_29433 [Thalassiosira oceanica]|eukprot:EJK51396.1 hypothetical protein THAOC_29433 [Thalassiosira oceanica]